MIKTLKIHRYCCYFGGSALISRGGRMNWPETGSTRKHEQHGRMMCIIIFGIWEISVLGTLERRSVFSLVSSKKTSMKYLCNVFQRIWD